jgi:hypothetical protein
MSLPLYDHHPHKLVFGPAHSVLFFLWRSKGGRVEQPHNCWILQMMPPELLYAILCLVRDDDSCVSSVAAWCLTCSNFNDVCDIETRCRATCMATSPVLFGLGLSPIFGGPFYAHPAAPPNGEDSAPASPSSGRMTESSDAEQIGTEPGAPRLTWQQRAELLPYLPQRLVLCEGNRGDTKSYGGGVLKRIFKKENKFEWSVDTKTGRYHMHDMPHVYQNLHADHPFLSANEEALARVYEHQRHAGGEEDAKERKERFMRSVLFRGVEYFEMSVLQNTVVWNKAAAIGIAQRFSDMSFLGWTPDAIAYHSDDGTIRGGPDDLVPSPFT